MRAVGKHWGHPLEPGKTGAMRWIYMACAIPKPYAPQRERLKAALVRANDLLRWSLFVLFHYDLAYKTNTTTSHNSASGRLTSGCLTSSVSCAAGLSRNSL